MFVKVKGAEDGQGLWRGVVVGEEGLLALGDLGQVVLRVLVAVVSDALAEANCLEDWTQKPVNVFTDSDFI